MKIETKRPIIKKKKVSGESIVKMKTEITELLGIEYPIIQGGMAWVAEYHLAAAVSEAGGLGIIGAASAPPEWVRDQIQKAKKMTDKPFGVNIMLMSPYADEIAKVIVEEKVKVVTTGAGSPEMEPRGAVFPGLLRGGMGRMVRRKVSAGSPPDCPNRHGKAGHAQSPVRAHAPAPV